jgi:sugar/nucleoside kinase (ribokinase family)
MNRRIGPFERIAVFGGATIDRLAMAREAPVAGASNPGTLRTMPGGVGFNLACNLARLGHAVRLVARTGEDGDREALVAAAAALGIDTVSVTAAADLPTATYTATFDHAGGLVIGIADMAVYDRMRPANILAGAAAARADDFWVVDANLPGEVLDFLVGEASAAGRPVAALTVSPVKAVRLKPLLDRLAVLFTNRREAAALLDLPPEAHRPSPSELAAELSRLPGPPVVLSNSADPLVVAVAGETRLFAPLRAAVTSVNGAGDALAAGTIHGLAMGRTLPEAVISGLATAALTVESELTTSPLVSRQAIADRIASRGHAP